MDNNRDINSYFIGVLENIELILNNDFYNDKEKLEIVKIKIQDWHDSYKKKKSLKDINPNELKKLDVIITDFFADYIKTEPIKNNYAERLLYDFGHLEKYWKDEMLGGK